MRNAQELESKDFGEDDLETSRTSSPAWEDHRWTSLPHLAGALRTDVCVVGLGGSGLTAVHALLDRGVNVIGIDAGQIAGGAAGANGGFLLAGTARFYHRTIEDVGRHRARALYELTVREIERMQGEMPDIVRRTGSLRIAMSEDENADCDKQFTAMRDDELPVEKYRGPEGDGLLIPTDATFNPLARCRRLAQSALQRGARLFENAMATRIHGDLVSTEFGHVRCGRVIVAVDGKLELIFPELAHRIRTARLQMIGTASTREVKIDRAVYARFGYEYWQQLADGRVVLGGFRDAGGDVEWTSSATTTKVIQEKLTRFLREHLKIRAPITHRWAASVGYTETALPIVEEVRTNVWAIGGYNGTGNVVGALCGRAVAEKITTSSSNLFESLTARG